MTTYLTLVLLVFLWFGGGWGWKVAYELNRGGDLSLLNVALVYTTWPFFAAWALVSYTLDMLKGE